MAKTGKVTAKPAARTRFFLSIKRERKLAAPWREETAEALRRELLCGSTRSYMLSGAVTLNSARPFSSTVRVAVHRYSRAACRASSLPLTRQAL